MKSFLRNVVNRKEPSGGGLVGRTVKIGAFTVRVEAHIADGGFASIYRVRPLAQRSFACVKVGDGQTSRSVRDELRFLRSETHGW